jgi:hypothetical protein
VLQLDMCVARYCSAPNIATILLAALKQLSPSYRRQ